MAERVLQFGTGMLLRAICATAVDAANRAGDYDGRIVVVQSTRHGLAAAINRQRGAFDLLERGIEDSAPVQRARRIESISRALVADAEWEEVRELALRPELRVIVSNVTEAGFRLDDGELAASGPMPPASFPGKLTDLLHVRFLAVPDSPVLFVIPTELVPDNGPRLAAMVDTLARQLDDGEAFRSWITARVRFCSSLVDRITTGAPGDAPEDVLVTVTEPHSLWAIEGDPAELREAFPVDAASRGTVIFAADISRYRERKLRLLNGTHTAVAPMALMAGLRTVREAIAHPKVGPFLRTILFDELVPSTGLPGEEMVTYAQSVIDRLSNPWIEHEWQVIATNQTAKLRVRVIPAIISLAAESGRAPEALTWALAASLRYVRTVGARDPAVGEGWWRGASYRIVDVDLGLIDAHWRIVDPAARPEPVPDATLAAFAASVLADAATWGRDLALIPGLVDGVATALIGMELRATAHP